MVVLLQVLLAGGLRADAIHPVRVELPSPQELSTAWVVPTDEEGPRMTHLFKGATALESPHAAAVPLRDKLFDALR